MASTPHDSSGTTVTFPGFTGTVTNLTYNKNDVNAADTIDISHLGLTTGAAVLTQNRPLAGSATDTGREVSIDFVGTGGLDDGATRVRQRTTDTREPQRAAPGLRGGERALRQREGLARRLEHVRARLEGWRDASGVFALPASTTRDPARLARAADSVRAMMGEVAWLRAQALALAEPETGEATLLFEGLAGPFEATLIWWRRLLRSLSGALELELSFKARRGDRWVNADAHEPSVEDLTALSVSGEGLGLTTLLQALEGYTWSPRPASEGHHALVRAFVRGDVVDAPLQHGQQRARTGHGTPGHHRSARHPSQAFVRQAAGGVTPPAIIF
jgi:hypothetical protein